jgi:hypothetical protein
MNATHILPGLGTRTTAEYDRAVMDAESAISNMCRRLASCTADRLPGRALGSLAELQRVTDQLRIDSSRRKTRAHWQLIDALEVLSADVADLARGGGSPDELLRSRALRQAGRAIRRLPRCATGNNPAALPRTSDPRSIGRGRHS